MISPFSMGLPSFAVGCQKGLIRFGRVVVLFALICLVTSDKSNEMNRDFVLSSRLESDSSDRDEEGDDYFIRYNIRDHSHHKKTFNQNLK